MLAETLCALAVASTVPWQGVATYTWCLTGPLMTHYAQCQSTGVLKYQY
jgi:hypothetical protein